MNNLITVKKSPIHGLGVYAVKNIPEGMRIIEYLGEKISKIDEVKREKINDQTGVTYIFDYNNKFSLLTTPVILTVTPFAAGVGSFIFRIDRLKRAWNCPSTMLMVKTSRWKFVAAAHPNAGVS